MQNNIPKKSDRNRFTDSATFLRGAKFLTLLLLTFSFSLDAKKSFPKDDCPPINVSSLTLLNSSLRFEESSQETQRRKTITGTVKSTDGEVLIGAGVIIKGTKIGTVTDFDGRFSIDASPDQILQISCIGFNTQDIQVGDKQDIVVALSINTTNLDEVVVVGYGTQKKVDLVGSVAALNVDEKIYSRSIANVSSGLSGLIPGLQVTQTTSMAGKDNASLLIRGLGTVNSTSPLIVVDGMPDVDINRINMADVESISVLKDAASASIYGSRAANGVILITTRTGQKGKTSISFTGSYAIERPTRSYDFMDDYPRALTLEQFRAASGTKRESYIFKDGTIDQWSALKMIDPLRYPSTDWFKTFMRNGKLQNYTVSATGGNDKSNFYVSIGLMDKEGVQMNNDYTRFNTRFNFDYKIFNNVKVGARVDGNWSEFTYSGMANGITDNNTSNSGGGDMQFAIAGVTPYDPISGRYGGAMAYGEDLQAYNPYAYFKNMKPKQSNQQLNGSMYLEWNVFDGFTAHIDYALSYSNYFQKRADTPTGKAYDFQNNKDIGRFYIGDDAGVSDNNSTSYKTQLNGRIQYNKTLFNNHSVDAMLIYSEEYWHTRSTAAARNDRLHSSTSELNAALTNVISNSGDSSSEGLRSYIGRLNYNAYNKYLFEFSFRVDGSSKFAKGHQYGFFPTVAAGWRFTEESFINKHLPQWFSNGKLRLSWGKLGDNSGVGRFEQQETLSILNYMTNEVVKGFVNKKMINRNLTWEVSTDVNIGLDLGFLNNRLRTEFDFYHRVRTKMNRPSEMSIHLDGAYNAPRKNIGDMLNRGIETNITWKDNIGDFEYSVNINASYNRNTLKKWNEFLSRGWIFLDMPYHFLYTYENDGIAQTWEDIYSHAPQGLQPGDVIRKDLNGDGIIDSKDKKAFTNIQRDRPTTTFGITLQAAWKGFDISMLFNGGLGRKDYWLTDFNNTAFNDRRYAATWDHWNKPWSLENRDGSWARLGTASARGDNDYWLYSFDYLRLKNLMLGYNIPQKVLSSIAMSNLRIYLSAENLFTITKYPGLDPEKTNSARDLYPINRSYSIGLNINF
jgi:TonB-linked SusC/RagA family outer membrane protein